MDIMFIVYTIVILAIAFLGLYLIRNKPELKRHSNRPKSWLVVSP